MAWKLPHHFASQKGESLSVALLDDNSAAIERKVAELEDRLNAAGELIRDLDARLLGALDAIAKLQPKRQS